MRQWWEEPTFVGMAGKLGSAHLSARENWPTVAPSTTFDLPVVAIHASPHGTSQIHRVNALDPGTAPGYAMPLTDDGAVVPAGRMPR